MQPLVGVTILDLTRLLPGPFCSWLLRSWGARVIKLEEPVKGDYLREMLPLWYEHLNAGAESVALDLKRPEGRDLFLRMAERADMVLESFRPGVMERLGLGYEALVARNPRLVLVSICGYRAGSPDAARAGHDLNYLSRSGLLSLLDGPPAFQLGDLSAGLMAAAGGLAALAGAKISGKGSHVEATLVDSLKVLGSLQALEALDGSLLPREAMDLGGRLPRYRLYRTADGGQVSLAALEQKFWGRFCAVVGRPEWSVRQSDPELAVELEALFASRPLADWADLARREPEICLEPVVGISQAAASRGEMQPVSFGGERPISQGWAPAKGEHTRQVLHEWGLSEQEILALLAEGVVAGAKG